MSVCVKVSTTPECQGIPAYATPGAAGMDLVAAMPSEAHPWVEYRNGSAVPWVHGPEAGYPFDLHPGRRVMIPTGIRLAIPKGYEGQVRPRSGLALRDGITIPNAPGTVDADYRGVVGVVLANIGRLPVRIQPGDRIAQIVFAKVERASLKVVDELDATERGSGGFGHTGV